MPTWVLSATADTWIDGEFETAKALANLPEQHLGEIAQALAIANAARQPMNHDRLVQRLTALGMTMAPNRPPAEASVWVREMARLLGDLPEDLLCQAIDDCQRKLRFLPTVAEIRELAEPGLEERNRRFYRLDAMRRYIESGQPIPKIGPPRKPVMDRRGEAMTQEETDELNSILEGMDACSRYRSDGSRYTVKEKKPAPNMERRNPTRQDYIDLGVDPAVLDRLEAEKRQAAGAG